MKLKDKFLEDEGEIVFTRSKESLKASEIRLLHTVGFILGLIYMGLLIAKLETKWFGWAILIGFSAFMIAIVGRWIMDLVKGEL